MLRDGKTRRLKARIDDPYADFVHGESLSPALEGALIGEATRRSNRGQTRVVVVGPIRPGSPAWQNGLREDDLIINSTGARSLRSKMLPRPCAPLADSIARRC